MNAAQKRAARAKSDAMFAEEIAYEHSPAEDLVPLVTVGNLRRSALMARNMGSLTNLRKSGGARYDRGPGGQTVKTIALLDNR